ncbi:MAG: CBS domain-containing protein [Acidimicrobiia bacterium]|nr:CBS domain-containing protein [Acidimicrobiia bacterium]
MAQPARHQPTKVDEIVHELMVRDVMTDKLITVSPRVRVRELRELLRVNRISGLPVVDGDRMVGIISVEDFINCLASRENGSRVEDKMTREVKTVHADDPLVSAIAHFETTGLGRLPVIERQGGQLVGIITKGDVIAGLLRKLEIDFHQEEVHRHRASHIFEDIEADSTTLVFRYEVPGQEFERAGEASSRLRRTLRRLGLRPTLVRRVAIASYEAEMNLVIFTQGGRIEVHAQPSQIRVQVEDSGPGISDVEAALEPGFSTASDRVRELGFGAGMGLPNIRKMSDRLEIDSHPGDGTRLEMLFTRREMSCN